jgi:hypothetical protein
MEHPNSIDCSIVPDTEPMSSLEKSSLDMAHRVYDQRHSDLAPQKSNENTLLDRFDNTLRTAGDQAAFVGDWSRQPCVELQWVEKVKCGSQGYYTSVYIQDLTCAD